MVVYKNKKTKRKVYLNRLIFSLTLTFLIILIPLIIILISNKLFPWQFPTAPLSILGLFLAGLGVFYTVVSIGDIYFDGWGFSFFVNKPKRLVMSGVYSQCRHPFYFGYSFYLLGLFLINANLLDILVFLVYLFIILIKTYYEEKYLRKKFGEEYENFSTTTPIFIPYKKYIKGRSPSISFLLLYILGKSLLPLLFKCNP